MRFPQSLDILLSASCVKNATEKGEVTEASCDDLEMVDLLSRALGFTYKVYSGRFRENGDLYVGNIVLTEKRYSLSTYPHYVEDSTFAVSNTGYVSNSGGFLRAFTTPVWIAFLLSVLLMTMATFLIFRQREPLSTVLFYASVTLAGKHRDWKPRSRAQRWVVLSWSVGLTFLTLAYAAVLFLARVLLSFLTVPRREKGIANLDELYDAIKKGKATALKFKASNTDSFLIRSGSEKLKLIGRHIRRQNTIRTGSKGNFREVIKPNAAVFKIRSDLEELYGGDDHFVSTDSVFLLLRVIHDWSEDGFCCMEEVNAVIHRIWGSGLYKKKIGDKKFKKMLYLRSTFPNLHSRDENTIRPISLSDMSGSFYLLLVGHILGLICLVCEVVTHRYRCKHQAIPNRVRRID